MILSIAELKEQIDTDLSADALTDIIDSVEADIARYAGAADSDVVEMESKYYTVLQLPVRAGSISSIEEWAEPESEPTKTTLSADDYSLSDDGWSIWRRSDGTNAAAYWGFHVVITYVPYSDVARRKQAVIKLARLEINHSGYSRETAGDWSASTRSLRNERAQILRSLGVRPMT